MSELSEKVKASIERLKAFEPRNGEGYYLAFSGGKDSVVCKALLQMAGVKFDAHYRVTTVDPPELVQFIREKHPDVMREKPIWDKDYKNPKLAGKPITMWNLIPEKMMPPTRVARYCCEYLKESGGDGRMTVTGVRWDESANRKRNQGAVTIFGRVAGAELSDGEDFAQTPRGGAILTNDNEESRRVVESCYKRHKTLVNPIIEWTDRDVWDFIHSENIPYCGFKRLGCIGCPMARPREREHEFLIYPKFKAAYMLAFEKMLQLRTERHAADPSRPIWRTGGFDNDTPTAEDVFNWWMEYDVLPGQINMFEGMGEE